MGRHGTTEAEAIRSVMVARAGSRVILPDTILMDISVKKGKVLMGVCPSSLEQFLKQSGEAGREELLDILEGLEDTVNEIAGRTGGCESDTEE